MIDVPETKTLVALPTPSPREGGHSIPSTSPRKREAFRAVLSSILLDSLRSAQTYVKNYAAGRGAE
jgi:hypothetical protein